MPLKHLTKNNFEQFINSNRICVIDFYADWCGPCKMLSPIIESLSNKINNVSFAKINVDEEHLLAQTYNIRSIPTILIFKNAKLSDQFTGFRSEEEITTIIKHL